ncbi:MAG TPA: hypothetical protein VFH14_01650 [Gemmatimonadaceae bacterium]|nr:hypothetical protein [Gemmatimonadaceae bacterium]
MHNDTLVLAGEPSSKRATAIRVIAVVYHAAHRRGEAEQVVRALEMRAEREYVPGCIPSYAFRSW